MPNVMELTRCRPELLIIRFRLATLDLMASESTHRLSGMLYPRRAREGRERHPHVPIAPPDAMELTRFRSTLSLGPVHVEQLGTSQRCVNRRPQRNAGGILWFATAFLLYFPTRAILDRKSRPKLLDVVARVKKAFHPILNIPRYTLEPRMVNPVPSSIFNQRILL